MDRRTDERIDIHTFIHSMKTKRVKEKYSSSNNFSPTKPIQESVCVYVWMNWVVFNEKKIQTLQSCWLIGSQTDERMDRRQIRRYIDTTIGTSTTNNREWWRGIWRNNQRKTKYYKKENNNTNLIKRKEKHCSHTCVEAATEAITKLRHHHQRHPAVMSSLRTEGRCLGLPLPRVILWIERVGVLLRYEQTGENDDNKCKK